MSVGLKRVMDVTGDEGLLGEGSYRVGVHCYRWQIGLKLSVELFSQRPP